VIGFFICSGNKKLEKGPRKSSVLGIESCSGGWEENLEWRKNTITRCSPVHRDSEHRISPPTGQNPFPGETPEYPLPRRKFDRMEELF